MLLEELDDIFKKTHELFFRRNFIGANKNLNTLPVDFNNFINYLFLKADLFTVLEDWNELLNLVPIIEKQISELEERISWFTIHFDEEEKDYLREIVSNYHYRLEQIKEELNRQTQKIEEKTEEKIIYEEQIRELKSQLIHMKEKKEEEEAIRKA
ncbi:MAG: hypothetical protein ACP5QY_08505, partial [Candidatus Hydrogenedens sp.]